MEGRRKPKTKFKSHRDAVAALRRIWEEGVIRNRTPIRAYREGNWWYLTSKQKIGSNASEIRDITSEQISDRIRKLEGVSRKISKSGKRYAAKLTGEQESTIIRKYMTGQYSQAQLAEEMGVAESTVSRVVSDWIKDRRLVAELNNEY